jgi:TP901 family phage tail tape measure protein
MADKKLTLIVQAKNMVAQGLSAAGGALSRFGASVASVFGSVAKWGGIISSVLGGISFVRAIKDANEFEKKIGQIATLTDMTFGTIKKQVRDLAAEFGLAKEELTKGLYDALSAGIPSGNVFEFMRAASRVAVAGASSASEAVGLLVGAMNQFNIPATKAEAVADVFFNTVRYGVTTIPELAQHLSTVGPIAAASGVSLEELSAALMTLTMKKVPTAMAVTQIRAAIVSMNETLGDGWSATMTLQDGMIEMAKRAKGSQNALKDMTGRVEGMNAILSMTGDNAGLAAKHLDIAGKSAGAAADAFSKMAHTNKLDRLLQSLHNILITVGDAALTVFSTTIEKGAIAAARLGEALAKWVEGDRIKKLREDIDGIVSALGQGGEARSDVVQALGGVIVAAFKDGASLVGDAIRDAFADTWIGRRMKDIKQGGQAIGAMTVLGVSGDALDKTAQMLDQLDKPVPKVRALTAALEKLNDVTAKSNAGGYGSATDQFERAQQAAKEAAKETARQKAEGGGIGIAAVNEAEIESARRKANLEALEKETAEKVKASQATVDAIQAEIDEKEEVARLEKEIAGQRDQLNEAVFQKEKERHEKILAMEEYKARIKVKDFVELQKANDKAKGKDDRDAERDQRKADRLRARMGRGERIGGGQERWLEGFDAIRNAQAGLGVANQNLEEIRKRQDSRNLELIKQALDKNLVELGKKIRLG